MTRNEAYKILGVASTSGIDQIEEAYKNRLSKCQLQLVPGQSLATRQKAQDLIIAIQEAWQLLKNQTSPKSAPSPVNMPIGNSPRTTGFVVALILMGLIGALCTHTSGHKADVENVDTAQAYASNSAVSEPVVASNPAKAQLRILAAPWCYVEIDGKSVGTSGRLEAFEVSDGPHTLVLRRNGKVLTKNVSLNGGYLTVIRIDFERGLIRVD